VLPEQISYVIPGDQVIFLVTDERSVHVTEQAGGTLQLRDSFGSISIEEPGLIGEPTDNQVIHAPTMTVIPQEGGRGPVINNGETITIGLLLSLLSGQLDEAEFTAALNTRLDEMHSKRLNSREQSGYGTHNTVVTLSDPWTDRAPIIELVLGPGQTMARRTTQVGVEPNCITYIEIPEQECLFGHSGLSDAENAFTLKAAILEKSAPTQIALAWIPATVTGPPNLTVLSTESVQTAVTAACMGFRIQGTIGLVNAATHAVEGTMYLEMTRDSIEWVVVAQLFRSFSATDSNQVTYAFDEFLLFDQAAHNYKFRGRLEVSPDSNDSRRLTGSVHVATVDEVGTGTILSNDVQIKWSVKE